MPKPYNQPLSPIHLRHSGSGLLDQVTSQSNHQPSGVAAIWQDSENITGIHNKAKVGKSRNGARSASAIGEWEHFYPRKPAISVVQCRMS